MTKKQIQHWNKAAKAALLLMGKKKVWGEKSRWMAEDDPLAWVCLTQSLIDLKRY